MINNKV